MPQSETNGEQKKPPKKSNQFIKEIEDIKKVEPQAQMADDVQFMSPLPSKEEQKRAFVNALLNNKPPVPPKPPSNFFFNMKADSKLIDRMTYIICAIILAIALVWSSYNISGENRFLKIDNRTYLDTKSGNVYFFEYTKAKILYKIP